MDWIIIWAAMFFWVLRSRLTVKRPRLSERMQRGFGLSLAKTGNSEYTLMIKLRESAGPMQSGRKAL